MFRSSETENAPDAGAADLGAGVTAERSVLNRAVSAARVHPVLLDEKFRPTEHDIVLRAILRRLCRAEVPGAFVRVLLATLVEPRIQIRVGHAFGQLVRDEARHGVARQIAVRRGGLLGASRRASRRVSNEAVFDVSAVERAVGM